MRTMPLSVGQGRYRCLDPLSQFVERRYWESDLVNYPQGQMHIAAANDLIALEPEPP